MKILVVEDNEIAAEIIEKNLTIKDYQVTIKNNASSALELLDNEQFDLLMLDIMLPDKSGIDLCKEIKSKPDFVNLPIIFLSSLTEKSVIVEAFKAGASDFISKPFEKEELLARLKVHIELKKSRDTILLQNDALKHEISKRSELENELDYTKNIYRSVVEDQTELICRIKPNGFFTFANEAYCKFFKQSYEEIINNNLFDMLEGEGRKIRYRERFSFLPNEDTKEFQEYSLEEDGTKIWHTWTIRALRNTEGEVTEIQGVGRDYTEKKKMLDELRESEAQFRQLAENIDGVVWMREGDRVSLLNQKGFKDIFETNEEFNHEVFDTVYKYIHKDDLEKVLFVLNSDDYLKYGKLNIEYRIINTKGKLKWLWSRAFPIKNDKGEIIKIAGIAEDITAIKDAGELAQKANLAIEKSNTVVIVWQDLSSFTIGYISESIRHYGYSSAEFYNSKINFEDIIISDEIDTIREQIKKYRSLKTENYSIDLQIINRDSTISTVELRTSEIVNNYGVYVSESVMIDFTERNLAVDKLLEAEKKWQFAIEGSGDGLWQWDIKSGEFTLSDKLLEILLLKENERLITIINWETKIHPEDLPLMSLAVESVLKKKTPFFKFEHRLKSRDGDYKWVLDRGIIIKRDNWGDPLVVIGTITDITERKNTEILLKDLTERLTLAKNSANIGIFDFDIKNNILQWDEALYDLFGLNSESFENARAAWVSSVDSKDIERIDKETVEAINGDSKYITEFKYKTADGKNRIMKSISDIYYDEFNEAYRMIGVNYDITESKAKEKEIQDIKALLESTFEQNPVAMILVGYPDMTIKFINSAYKKLLLIEDEPDKTNTSLLELKSSWKEFTPDGKEISLFEMPLARSLKGYSLANQEFLLKRKDGSSRWELINSTPIYNAGGELIAGFAVIIDITQMKQVNEQIKQSEDNFRFLFESVPLPVTITRVVDARFLYANNNAIDVFELNKDYYKEDNAWNLYVDKRDRVEIVQQVTSTGGIREYELSMRTMTGKSLWFSMSMTKINFNGSEALLTTLFDITERKKTLSRLAESEEKYRLIAENMHDIVWRLDKELNFSYVSPSSENVKGNSPFDLLGRSVLDIILPEEREKLIEKHLEKVEEFNKGEKPSPGVIELKYMQPNGNPGWFEITFKALIVNREFTGYQGITREITKRKLSEIAIIESENRFRTLVNSSPDAIVISDTHCIIKFTSQICSKVFGCEDNHFISKPLSEIVDESERLSFAQSLKRIQCGSILPAESYIARKNDGTKIFIEISYSSLKNMNNQITEFFLIIRDITERKKIEFQLTEAKNRAEEANKTKSEFIANISHEIRTPLNAIIGFADILRPTMNNKQNLDYIDGIRRGGKNLLAIINDILDISKIESGHINISKTQTNLLHIVNDTKQIFSMKSIEKNLEFIIDIKDNVPKYIIIDEIRLRQIITNLLANAFKFTYTGFVKLSIEAKTINNETDIYFAVEDTGIGIPANQLKIIFEPFRQQEGQSTRKFGGTGLGLTISQKLAVSLNGEIQVKSVPNKGSIFTLVLRSIKTPRNTKINNQALLKESNKNRNFIRLIAYSKSKSTVKNLKNCLTETKALVTWAKSIQALINEIKSKSFQIVVFDFESINKEDIHSIAGYFKADLHKDLHFIFINTNLNRIGLEYSKLFYKYSLSPKIPDCNDINMVMGELIKIKEQVDDNKEINISQLIDKISGSLNIEKFNKYAIELYIRWNEIKSLMDTEEIIKFAGEIIIIARNLNNKHLEIYGEILKQEASNFELDKMNITFKLFEKLIEQTRNR